MNFTPNADSIKGIPFWDFGLLNDDQLDGLWGFVDMMPDHVQGALEEARKR